MKPSNNNDIDLRRLIRSVRKLWWLYAGSFVLLMGAAVYYCLTRPAAYESHSLIMIEDSATDGVPSAQNGMAAMMRTFSVGGFASSSVDNEILLLGSHDVLIQTVKQLGLNRTYTSMNGMKRKGLFGDSPVMLEAPEEFFDTLTTGFTANVRIAAGKADIEVTRGRLWKRTVAEAKGVTLPHVQPTPYGPLTFMPGPGLTTGYDGRIRIDVCGNEAAQARLYKDVQINIANKLADAISLDLTDNVAERGRTTLNTIMATYNAKRLGRKHENANDEVRFYDARIAELFAALTESEKEIEKYQTENKLSGVYVEAEALVKSSVVKKEEIKWQQDQILYYEQVLDALKRDRGDELLPFINGWGTPQIEEYNKALTERKNLARSAKEGNRALQRADETLADMKELLTRNMTEVLANARNNLKSMYGITGAAESRINSMPHHEREFLNMTRDKNMKNELYLFLMQKRENAMLEANSTSNLGFVVDEAYTDVEPTRKRCLIIMCAALLLALIIPTGVAIIRTLTDRRIHEPLDLARTGLEKNTVMYRKDSDMNRLRTLILSDPGVRRIYVAAKGDAEFPTSALADSLRGAGKVVNISSGHRDNDELLRENACNDDAGAYTLITVPATERLSDLRPVLGGRDSMLIVAIECSKVKRRYVSELMKELGDINAGVVIMDK